MGRAGPNRRLRSVVIFGMWRPRPGGGLDAARDAPADELGLTASTDAVQGELLGVGGPVVAGEGSEVSGIFGFTGQMAGPTFATSFDLTFSRYQAVRAGLIFSHLACWAPRPVALCVDTRTLDGTTGQDRDSLEFRLGLMLGFGVAGVRGL